MHIIPKVAIGIVAAGLALTGCSPAVVPAVSTPAPTAAAVKVQPGGEVDTDQLLDAMAAASKSVKTSKTIGSMDIAMSGGKSMSMTMEVVSDLSDPAHPRLAANENISGQEIKVVVEGDSYYMSMAALGSKWIKVSKADLEKQGNSTASWSDQGAMLVSLKSSVKKIVYVGDEDVNGVATKHYTLTLDSDAFTKTAGASASASPTGADMPYDIWVDANGLTRKYRMTMTVSGSTTSFEGTVTNYNEPVTITVPPASEITTMPGVKG